MRSRHRAARFMADSLTAQANAWVTLGVRVLALLAGTMSPAESRRMVGEKVAAMVESAQAVHQASARAMRDPKRFPPTPAAMVSGWLALSEAASRPYHKRVKGNAKRLGKSGKGRSG